MQSLSKLEALARILLDDSLPASSLRPEVIELLSLFEDATQRRFASNSDIASGETETRHGLAISPTMAALCVSDYVRTIVFLRGIHQAVNDLLHSLPTRPINVLYVGCGPYATLAVPLFSVFTASDVKFTLLDVHSDAIDSVKDVVNAFGLSESISEYVNEEASEFCLSETDHPPDLVILEVMQACLEKEPQVAISRMLLNAYPEAILIPESVSIDLGLADYGQESPGGCDNKAHPQVLGTAFELSKTSIFQWSEEVRDRLPGNRIQLDGSLSGTEQIMLCTRIKVYGDHYLGIYDSGLTCPRILPVKGHIKPGLELNFSYNLGPHPQLVADIESQ